MASIQASEAEGINTRSKRPRPQDADGPEPSEGSIEQVDSETEDDQRKEGVLRPARRSTTGTKLSEALQGIRKRAYKKVKVKTSRKPSKQSFIHGFARPPADEPPRADDEGAAEGPLKPGGNPWDSLDQAVPFLPTYTGRAGGVVPLPLQSNIHKSGLTLAKALRHPPFLRWVRSAFLYSSVDSGWYARNDWAEWLAKVGMAHVKMTRAEWSMLRKKSGFRRRFSMAFVEQQRSSLEAYRTHERTLHAQWAMGGSVQAPTMPDGTPFPYAIPQPLGLDGRVTAVHPLHRGISTGTIVAMSRAERSPGQDMLSPFALPYRFTIQFDRAGDGVWSVPESDVFPHGKQELIYGGLSYVPSGLAAVKKALATATGAGAGAGAGASSAADASMAEDTAAEATAATEGAAADATTESAPAPAPSPASSSAFSGLVGVHPDKITAAADPSLTLPVYKLGEAPPQDLTNCRAAVLPVMPLSLPSSNISAVAPAPPRKAAPAAGQGAAAEASASLVGMGSSGSQEAGYSQAGPHMGGAAAWHMNQATSLMSAATNPPKRPPVVREQSSSGPSALGYCTLDKTAPALVAAGQPVRVSVAEDADLVLRAFSALQVSQSAGPSEYSPLLLLEGDGVTPVMASLLTRPLPRLPDVKAVSSAMPLLPLASIGPDTASVVALAAHCGSTLATALAETITATARLQQLIRRKDRVLRALRHRMAIASATASAGALSSTSWNASRALLSNPGFVWLLECLKACNASIALHSRVLQRLQKVQAKAAEGADSAVVASGLAAPARSGVDALGLGRGGPGPMVHGFAESDSPFVTVALSAASALVADPTGTSTGRPAPGMSTPFEAPGSSGAGGTSLMLDPSSTERIDAVTARSGVKAAPLLANATRDALLGAADQPSAASASPAAKAAAGTAASRLVVGDQTGREVPGGSPGMPASKKALQALQLALALQAQADPRAASAAAAAAGSSASPASSGVGAGLSALESFVTVQRALEALAPVHTSNKQLYDDVIAAVSGIRATIASV